MRDIAGILSTEVGGGREGDQWGDQWGDKRVDKAERECWGDTGTRRPR